MSDIIYKMNIIDFCNSNNIKWFPIILDENKTPISINHELYKRTKKGHRSERALRSSSGAPSRNCDCTC